MITYPLNIRFDRFVGMAWVTVLLASLNGCAMVKVSSTKPADYITLQRGDILTTGKLSLATRDTLGHPTCNVGASSRR